MNIGVMQFANMNSLQVSKPIASKSPQSTEINQSTKFGQVFNSVVSSSKAVNNTTATESINTDALKEVLSAESVEELLDLLDIPHEQGLLLLQVGDEGQAVAVDELMDLNALLDILNLDFKELNTMVRELLGDEDVEIVNIWQFLELVNEQAPKVVGELSAALQGESNVTPKEAKTFIEFLKLTQLAGKQSDLVSDQPEQLTQLKELLTTVVAKFDGQSIANEKQMDQSTLIAQSETNKPTVQTTQTETKTTSQGLQQVVTKSETTETQSLGANTTQQITTKTITVTLPNTNQASQSEALVKEFQNLLNRSQITTTQGTTKLLLKLYPENLGSIRIEVMQKDGVLSARLLASTSLGKELLDGQIHQLRNAFAQANIQMDRIDIAQSLQEADLKRDQNLFSNLFNQQQHEEEEHTEEEQNDEEQVSFKDFLVNEEV